MPPTVVFHGSRDELRRLIGSVPGMLSGRVPDPEGVAKLLGYRVANALLSQVQQDYVAKARGGTDRAGIKWAPLAPSTIKKRLAKEQGGRGRGRAGGRKAAKKGRPPKPKALPPYAGRVEIGRDTGRQLRALAAGVEDQPGASPDQVVRLGPGELIVGTNVRYTRWFDRGGKHQPARPIVPPSGEIPPAYLDPLMDAAARGLIAIVTYLVERGYRA